GRADRGGGRAAGPGHVPGPVPRPAAAGRGGGGGGAGERGGPRAGAAARGAPPAGAGGGAGAPPAGGGRARDGARGGGGGRWGGVGPRGPRGVWAGGLPQASGAWGVPPVEVGSICPPDPRVVAFLLAEVGGRVVPRGDEVWLEAADVRSPLLRALGADGAGR